jgi:nitroreductase
MELYEVMRTAFSAREFTDEPVTDEVLGRILENARFAPSGGNRQGWHVIVVRDQATKDGISVLTHAPARRYAAQIAVGESPWNAITPTKLTGEQIAATPVSPTLSEPVRRAPVVLVVCVDLAVVASLDYQLPRVGIVSGASVYPLAWNILLAARNEGMGGTLTTMPIAEEPKLRELLGMPEHAAVCAVMPMGWPSRRITKLRRKAVREFVTRERWDGAAFEA